MFTPDQFRKRAANYRNLADATDSPVRRAEYGSLERSLSHLADNEQWLAENHDKVLGSDRKPNDPKQEEHILRCLGAAVLLQWGELPKAIQRQIFDAAGSVGNLTDTAALRAQIAQFLHDRNR